MDDHLAQKKCSTCGEVKPLSAFHKHSRNKDGLRCECKSCRVEKSAEYYSSNLERIKEYARSYRERQDGAIRSAYQRLYRANSPLLKQKKREYELSHREQLRETRRAWAEKNRNHINAKSRENGKKYRVRLALHCRQRYALKKGASGRHTAEQIKEIGDSQRWLCACCFIDVSLKYHVDHIMPLTKGGTNDANNLQILCQSCNTRKGSKYPWRFDMDMWVRRLQRVSHG